MTFQIEPLPPDEPHPEKKGGCLFRVITGIVILTLLASSLAAVAWFVTRQVESESTMTQFVAQELPAEENVVPTAEPTIVSQTEREIAPSPVANLGPNRIVLVNEQGQIETVAPDGTARRILSSEEYSFQYPAWSPDGKQIAALGSNRNGTGIFLMHDDDPGEFQEVLFGSSRTPFYLYWSPDSSKISFLASQIGRGMSLNIVDAEENKQSRQIASGSPFYWNWTADSQQLLIHSDALSEDAKLALIDKVNGDSEDEISSPGYFQAPGISPSGRFWAYSQIQDGGNSWLIIDDRENGSQQSQRHAASVALSWSPMEDKLAFISGDGEHQTNFWGPLRLLDTRTGEMQIVSSNLVLAFFWSPDGKKIATISAPLTSRLDEAIEVRNPKSRQLTKSLQSLTPPQQSSAHEFSISVINVEDGSGLELAQVALPTSFLTQFLVFFDQYSRSHSIWSPDSDALVLPVLVNRTSQLTVFGTKSGRMQEIGPGEIAFWSPQ